MNINLLLENIQKEISETTKVNCLRFERYSTYFRSILKNNGKVPNQNFLNQYLELYKLTIAINILLKRLYKLEESNIEHEDKDNFLLMKEINTLLYEKKYLYTKGLKTLEKSVLAYANLKYDKEYLTDWKGFLYGINKDFKFNLFSIELEDKKSLVIKHLKQRLDLTENIILRGGEGHVKWSRESVDFHLPIIYPTKLNLISKGGLDFIKKGSISRNPIKTGDSKGIYLIHFNILWKKVLNNKKEFVAVPDTLVYSYYYYHDFFSDFVITYLDEINRMSPFKYNVDATVFVIEKELNENLKSYPSDLYKEYKELSKESNRNLINFIQFIILVNKGSIYINNQGIINIINHLFNQSFKKVLLDMFGQLKGNLDLITEDIEEYINPESKNNILLNFMFVVSDMDKLLNSIKMLGINVNAGPQKHRAMNNLSKYKLSILDHSIRRSMYLYCKELDNYSDFNFTDQDFSFKNIHMNLGKVRW